MVALTGSPAVDEEADQRPQVLVLVLGLELGQPDLELALPALVVPGSAVAVAQFLVPGVVLKTSVDTHTDQRQMLDPPLEANFFWELANFARIFSFFESNLAEDVSSIDGAWQPHLF